ncbi:MAG: prephenate dehydrogenase/arogenate dehydrogenase family protein [Bryobacteraceae bacterium]
MKTVAIVGVGLIGGSFGLALRKAGFTGELLGVSSPAAIEAAIQRGAISRSARLDEAASAAELIYLAQPVDRILQTLEALGRLTRSDTLITDAGSTKAAIVQKASESLRSGTFLGGHPMAGKEQRGVEAAEADLFRGRPYVLTPTSAETALATEFREWLARMGAEIIEMSPAEHDATVAFTSHLPQILSTALARTLAEQHNRHLTRAFGPGLLDMTRLALSPPDLWLSILATNQSNVLFAMDELLTALASIRRRIASSGDPRPILDSAAGFAASLRKTDYTT